MGFYAHHVSCSHYRYNPLRFLFSRSLLCRSLLASAIPDFRRKILVPLVNQGFFYFREVSGKLVHHAVKFAAAFKVFYFFGAQLF
jgi:hypothetical protein